VNTQIIAIANQKGGVGKTTTCTNLGIGLAQAGRKVLLIDGDPQGSLTISLGHPQPDKLPFTLSDAMGRILMDEPLRPSEGILHHPEGVDLMPADIQLSGMEVSLVNAMSRETILRQYLDTVKGQYSHKMKLDAMKHQGERRDLGAYDITADELLAGTDTAKTESKTAQAEMLILELLANGKKMPSAELEKAVNDRGISSRTMRTAKSRIGDRLITEKDGTAWVCYLRN